jgi:hypothetical protein
MSLGRDSEDMRLDCFRAAQLTPTVSGWDPDQVLAFAAKLYGWVSGQKAPLARPRVPKKRRAKE